MKNPVKMLHDWVKTLPPAVQTAYYSVETAVIAGLAMLVGTLYTYEAAHGSLGGFDWQTQIRILYASILTAVLKAAWDLLKGCLPTQDPKPEEP